MRINNLLGDAYYKKMFGFEESKNEDLNSVIEKFLKGNRNISRIGFENIPYNFQIREILANSIEKYLFIYQEKENFRSSL